MPNSKKFAIAFAAFLPMFVASSLPATARCAVPACNEAVKAFLTHPSKNTLAVISETEEGFCWKAIESSNDNFNRLNRHVESGNLWAAQYMAKHLKQLDSGNLEDALVALGQFSDHDMEHFLFFAKNGLLSKNEFSDALTMLPLSLSDDPGAQLKYLRIRRTKVLGIGRRDLLEQKAQALAAVDKFAAEVASHIRPN